MGGLIAFHQTLIDGAQEFVDPMESILPVAHLLIILLQRRLQMMKEFSSGWRNVLVVR